MREIRRRTRIVGAFPDVSPVSTSLQHRRVVSEALHEHAAALPIKMDHSARFLTVLLICGLAIFQVYAAKGLYADGSYFLVDILSSKGFLTHLKARFFALLVTQAPVVLAMEAGVYDLNALIRIHSLGLIAIPLGFWISALLIQTKTCFFWLFVAAFSVSYLSSGFFAIGEFNIAYAMVAFCASILLKESIGKIGGAALVLTAIILARSYEAMIFLGPLLSIICIFRLLRDTHESKYFKSALIVSAFLFAADSTLSLWSVMFPHNQYALAAATDLRPALKSEHFIYLASMGLLFLTSWFFNIRHLNKFVIGTALLVSITYVSNADYWDLPSLHYQFRIVSGGMLAIVIAFSAFHYFSFELNSKATGSLNLTSTSIVVLLFVSLVYPFCCYTFGYIGWMKTFEQEVVSRTGMVPFENTKIPCARRVSELNALYCWQWTNPSLSQLLRINNAGAIILSSRDIDWPDPSHIDPNALEQFKRNSRLYR